MLRFILTTQADGAESGAWRSSLGMLTQQILKMVGYTETLSCAAEHHREYQVISFHSIIYSWPPIRSKQLLHPQ